MPTENSEPQYYKIIASFPEDTQSEQQQWLHNSCGGNLQIGSNALIRCEKCGAEHPVLSWIITEPYQLSYIPLEAKEMDFSTVASLTGQIAAQAGSRWLSELLGHVENEVGAENEQ